MKGMTPTKSLIIHHPSSKFKVQGEGCGRATNLTGIINAWVASIPQVIRRGAILFEVVLHQACPRDGVVLGLAKK